MVAGWRGGAGPPPPGGECCVVATVALLLSACHRRMGPPWGRRVPCALRGEWLAAAGCAGGCADRRRDARVWHCARVEQLRAVPASLRRAVGGAPGSGPAAGPPPLPRPRARARSPVARWARANQRVCCRFERFDSSGGAAAAAVPPRQRGRMPAPGARRPLCRMSGLRPRRPRGPGAGLGGGLARLGGGCTTASAAGSPNFSCCGGRCFCPC